MAGTGQLSFRTEHLAEGVTLYCGDMMEVLPTLGEFDACVTDPPYGIGMDGGNVGYKGFNNFEKLGWDKSAPQQAAFDLILSKTRHQVIWGGNYFPLPQSRCFFVWDKGAGFRNRSYAECEMAWASFDANARVLTHDPLARGDYKDKPHPTVKPVAVMVWCMGYLPSDVATVIDPFMGSGTTGIAAIRHGKAFYGIEREPSYFDIACRRIADALKQPDFFVEAPAPVVAKQEALNV